MKPNSKRLCRGFGAACLLAAIGMLVVGETVIKDKPSLIVFLLYWLGCLAFTLLAIISAVADVRALRREVRDEQRQMIDHTLQNIQPKPAAGNPRHRE